VLRPAQINRLAATFDLYRQRHPEHRDLIPEMVLITVDLGRFPLRVRLAYEIDAEITGRPLE
jgi:hypothetical protein